MDPIAITIVVVEQTIGCEVVKSGVKDAAAGHPRRRAGLTKSRRADATQAPIICNRNPSRHRWFGKDTEAGARPCDKHRG
jgi:hypothetical protein